MRLQSCKAIPSLIKMVPNFTHFLILFQSNWRWWTTNWGSN
jgi:hypothetical protein